MGRYLDILNRTKETKEVRKLEARATKETNLTKEVPLTADDIALQSLWRLAAKYRANLVAGGYDPANARVQLVDWRTECRLDVFTFHQILMRLVADGRVAHLRHHAWLAANYKPEETEI